MQDEQRALVMELAHILYRRNQIEVRRRRAKSKISYYEDLKRTVKQYKEDVAKVGSLTRTIRAMDPNVGDVSRDRLESQLEAQKQKVESYKTNRSRPFKFLNNVSELNKRILRYRAEYMKARYDTARLTCQTRKRVARLTNLLQCTIDYQFGTAFVQAIGFKDRSTPRISRTEFEAMYREVDANKAIEKALRSKNEEEKAD